LVARFEQKAGGTLLSGFALSDFLREIISSGLGGEDVVSRTFGVFNGVFSIITVLVISFYLVAEEKGMRQFIATLIPEHHQEYALGLVEKIQRKMGLWIIGQIILSFSIFILTFIGLTVLGVPNALLLATIAGLLEVVPYIGPTLSAVPALFFAFTVSPALALGVAILYLLIQKMEGYVLVPKIMEKTVGTSPLAVLIALLIGFKLAGVVGLLIAVPLVGAVTVVVNDFLANKSQPSQAT
jgi:predicted PurR-regulated permease PerM